MTQEFQNMTIRRMAQMTCQIFFFHLIKVFPWQHFQELQG